MALSDLQQANINLAAVFSTTNLSGEPAALDAANMLMEVELAFNKAADDGAAATATAETVLVKVPRRCKLVDATYIPATSTGLTANDTAYASVVLQSRDGAGGAAVQLGTTNTQTSGSGGSGNWSQFVKVPLVVSPFDPTTAVVPAGGIVTFKITKTGSGVVVPGGQLVLRLQYV